MGTGTQSLIDLLGGVAILLWGLRMVRTGAVRALGSHLRTTLGRATSNRFRAMGTGAGITAVVQSSTAVVLLVSSFAGRGIITTAAALACALGADVGTSLVAQVLSVDLGPLGPLLAFSGLTLFLATQNKSLRNIGRILLGISLVLLALKLIVAGSDPIRTSDVMHEVILSLAGEPLLAILIGALMTLISHSSLAMVLLVVSLLSGHQELLPLGYLLILGINLGGPLPAVMATLRSPAEARRVTLGNLLMRFLGVLIVLPFLGEIMPLVTEMSTAPARQLINFHMVFNIGLAVIFIGFTGSLGRLMDRLVAVPQAEGETVVQPLYLRSDQVEDTSRALSNATREALRMGDVVFSMLEGSIQAFDKRDPLLIKNIERKDDDVDRLNEAIKFYLTEISRNALSRSESARCMAIFSFVTNLEHIGDIVDRNLMDLATRKEKAGFTFSREGRQEIEALHRRVVDNFQAALNVFVSQDEDLAEQLLEEKRHFREAEMTATQRHLDRLRQGHTESMETSAIHLDLLRDLKRINSHITAVVYPVLKPNSGGFLPGNVAEAP